MSSMDIPEFIADAAELMIGSQIALRVATGRGS
jgi:hypothetical protein